MNVRGSLYLNDTPITSLPDNLKVRYILDLTDSKITSLPDDLTVGGALYLKNTPIGNKYTKDEIKKILPGVRGRIDL